MHILPFIIIIFCQYTLIKGFNCFKGKDDDSTPICLDINTRESTAKVKVTNRKLKKMVIYKIEPKNKAKIEAFTDGGIIIYEPKDGEKYKHLEVMCPRATDESIIVVLNYADGPCFGTSGHYYFNYKEGWSMMSSLLFLYLTNKMTKGIQFDKDTVIDKYYLHLNEIGKHCITINFSAKLLEESNITSVTRVSIKEDGVDTRIYTVDNKTIIYKVKSGSVTIWEKKPDVYGCYNVKVYYSDLSPVLAILVVRDEERTYLFYYKMEGENKFTTIAKGDFEDELKKLKGSNWSVLSSENYLDGLSYYKLGDEKEGFFVEDVTDGGDEEEEEE